MRADKFELGPLTRRSVLSMGVAALASTAIGADEKSGPVSATGFDPEALAGIQPMLQGAIAAGGFPGVVSLIWRKGKEVQCNIAGLRDIERGLPMERQTIFRIASMTKPITSVAALRLIEQKKMKLGDPIEKWAPEFSNMRVLRRADGPLDDTYAAKRSITIEDLMTHRSGLSYGFTSAGPLSAELMQKMGMGIESSLTPDEWLKAIASVPLAYAPGERFNYGHSTDVLGFIIARAMGKSLRDAMREAVFAPLAMHDTDFWISPEKRDRTAVLYSTNPGGPGFVPLQIASFVAPSPPAFVSAGQGLVSTVDDYLTFARLLLNRGAVNGVRLLRPETVELMTANRLSPEQRKIPILGGLPMWTSQGFGLGVSMILDEQAHTMIGTGSTGAYGWPGMFGGWWQADPKNDLILLWLIQAMPGPPAPGVMPRIPGSFALRDFQKRVYTALRP